MGQATWYSFYKYGILVYIYYRTNRIIYMRLFYNTATKPLFRAISLFLVIAFFISSLMLPGVSYAQSLLSLPAPGTMIGLSPSYTPAIISGLEINPEDPMQIDFIVDVGDDHLTGSDLQEEAKKLISYFLASMTVPEDDMWVNLSPYEKDRIVADGLGKTTMGRDMLAQDYLLKQITSSLMYPDSELGNEFWQKVYTKTRKEFGVADIPVSSFNKIWIVPDKAVIHILDNKVFITDSRLKVLLEEDYLAWQHANSPSKDQENGINNKSEDIPLSKHAKSVLREVILPELQKEINHGKNFAPLRQIYNSLILAVWYKHNLKESVFGEVYADRNKVGGIENDDEHVKNKIYDLYLQALEKGAYNYIREESDPISQELIPRKYFSGGEALTGVFRKIEVNTGGTIPPDSALAVRARNGDTAVLVRSQFETVYADAAMLVEENLINNLIVPDTRPGYEGRVKMRNPRDSAGVKLLYSALVANGTIADPEGHNSTYFLVGEQARFQLGQERLGLLYGAITAPGFEGVPYEDIVGVFGTIDEKAQKQHEQAFRELRPLDYREEKKEDPLDGNPFYQRGNPPGTRVGFIAKKWQGVEVTRENAALFLSAIDEIEFWNAMSEEEELVYGALIHFLRSVRDEESEVATNLEGFRTAMRSALLRTDFFNPEGTENLALNRDLKRLAERFALQDIILDVETDIKAMTVAPEVEVAEPEAAAEVFAPVDEPVVADSYAEQVRGMFGRVGSQFQEEQRPRTNALPEYYRGSQLEAMLRNRLSESAELHQLNGNLDMSIRALEAEESLSEAMGPEWAHIQVQRNTWRILNLFDLYLSLAGESGFEVAEGMLTRINESGLIDALLDSRDDYTFNLRLQAAFSSLYIDQAFPRAATVSSELALSCAEFLYTVLAEMFEFDPSTGGSMWERRRGILLENLREQVPLILIYLAQEGIYSDFPSYEYGSWTDSAGRATMDELFRDEGVLHYIEGLLGPAFVEQFPDYRSFFSTYGVLAGMQSAPHYYQLRTARNNLTVIQDRGLFLSGMSATPVVAQAARQLSVFDLSEQKTQARFWPKMRRPDYFRQQSINLGRRLVIIQNDDSLNPVERARALVQAFHDYRTTFPDGVELEHQDYLSLRGVLSMIEAQGSISTLEAEYQLIEDVVQRVADVVSERSGYFRGRVGALFAEHAAPFERFGALAQLITDSRIDLGTIEIDGDSYTNLNQVVNEVIDRWARFRHDLTALYGQIVFMSLVANEQMSSVDYHLTLRMAEQSDNLPALSAIAPGHVVARRFIKEGDNIYQQFLVDSNTPLASAMYRAYRNRVEVAVRLVTIYLRRGPNGTKRTRMEEIQAMTEAFSAAYSVAYADTERHSSRQTGHSFYDMLRSTLDHEGEHNWSDRHGMSRRLLNDPKFFARLVGLMQTHANDAIERHVANVRDSLVFQEILLFLNDFYKIDREYHQREGEHRELALPLNPVGYIQRALVNNGLNNDWQRDRDRHLEGLRLRHGRIVEFLKADEDMINQVTRAIRENPKNLLSFRQRLEAQSASGNLQRFNVMAEAFPAVAALRTEFQAYLPNINSGLPNFFFENYPSLIDELMAIFKEAHASPAVMRAFRRRNPAVRPDNVFHYGVSEQIVLGILGEGEEGQEVSRLEAAFSQLFGVPLVEFEEQWWMLPRMGNGIEEVSSVLENRGDGALLSLLNRHSVSTAETGSGQKSSTFGGIDFNANSLNLQQQGGILKFEIKDLPVIDPRMISGMETVIINVIPITNFSMLLGLNASE